MNVANPGSRAAVAALPSSKDSLRSGGLRIVCDTCGALPVLQRSSRGGMRDGLTIDALLDALVERVAVKLAERQATAPAPPVKRRLLTVEEAGAYLGRNKEAIQHLLAEGRIQPVRIDRRVFLDLRDLDRLIEQSKG